MTVLTPPAALSEATLAALTPFGRDFGPPDAPKELQSLNFDVILRTLSHIFRSCRPNGSQASSQNPKSIENVSKTISKGSETDPR